MASEKVEMYRCSETGKLFSTKKGADNSTIKAKRLAKDEADKLIFLNETNAQKQEKANYIRLNLTTIPDLHEMLIVKSNEFYDIEITDLFISIKYSDKVSNSHGSPMNKKTNWANNDKNYPTSFPGWTGNITGKFTIPKKCHGKETFSSANDVMFGNYAHGLFKIFSKKSAMRSMSVCR